MKHNLGWVLGTVLLLPLTSCRAATGYERVQGTIAFYGAPVQIKVPAQVTRGEPFTVSVLTQVGGCLEPGATEVRVEGLRADVTPYDKDFTTAGIPCTADVEFYTHTATLSFEEAGTAEIVFRGLEEAATGTREISVTRTLEVR